MRGLLIREPWIGKILAGGKTWEMRSTPTNIRGEIALIRQGVGQVVGTAQLFDSLPPLNRSNYMDHCAQHGIPPDMLDEVMANRWIYPWLLTGVQPVANPVPYPQKNGPVRFINLDAAVSDAIRRQRDAMAAGEAIDNAAVEATPPPRADQTIRIRGAAPSTNATPALGVGEAAHRSGGVTRFVYRQEAARAYGYPSTDGGFVVLKGSTAMRDGSPQVKRDRQLRQRLIDTGVLKADGDARLFRFTEDYEFPNSSSAAGVIKDGNASGPSVWKDEASGRSLRDHLAGSHL